MKGTEAKDHLKPSFRRPGVDSVHRKYSMSRCDSCCSYPNGFKTLVPCLLSNAAFILTSIATYSCHYAEIQLDGYSGVGIGIVYRETTYQDDWYNDYSDSYCTGYGYTENVLDTKFKAAQGCSFTAWIVGFIMCIVVWSIAPCVATPKEGWRIIGGLFFLIGEFFYSIFLYY